VKRDSLGYRGYRGYIGIKINIERIRIITDVA